MDLQIIKSTVSTIVPILNCMIGAPVVHIPCFNEIFKHTLIVVDDYAIHNIINSIPTTHTLPHPIMHRIVCNFDMNLYIKPSKTNKKTGVTSKQSIVINTITMQL